MQMQTNIFIIIFLYKNISHSFFQHENLHDLFLIRTIIEQNCGFSSTKSTIGILVTIKSVKFSLFFYFESVFLKYKILNNFSELL